MDASHNWPTSHAAATREMTIESLDPEAKGDGVFTIDHAGRVILCNEVCVTALGYASAAEIIGCHAILFLPVSDDALISQHPLLACARGDVGSVHADGLLLRADGLSIRVRYQIEPIWLEWGRRGAVCTFSVIEE